MRRDNNDPSKPMIGSYYSNENIQSNEEVNTNKEISINKKEENRIIDITAEEINELKTNGYDLTNDYEREKLFQDVAETVKNNALLGTLRYSVRYNKLELVPENKETQSMKDFMKSEIDSKEDTEMKKVVSTAAYIASQKGYFGENMKSTTPEQITHIVDNSLTASKLAYKVAKGEVDAEEVIDKVVDRTTASVGEIVGSAVKKTSTVVCEIIGGSIGAVLGPAGMEVGRNIGNNVGKFLGDVGEKVVRKGMEIVAEVAKPVVKTVVNAVKKGVNTVKEGAKKAWNWFKGLFS
ncbi:hypothetical protein [Brachyspira innocens]|uniref:hypothetical protein n=1 Tax=Brachyspira innocens TaxID=13264 RepID=UPI00036AC29B|nr:hypothetical protein [Brachyspira innocens]